MNRCLEALRRNADFIVPNRYPREVIKAGGVGLGVQCGAAINVFGGDAGPIDGRSGVINYRARNAGGVLLRNSRLHGSAEEEGEKQAERDCSSRPALFALPNTPYGEAGIGVERGFRERPGCHFGS